MGSKSKTGLSKKTTAANDIPGAAGAIPSVKGSISAQFRGRFKETGICIVLFLSALFLIIAISTPALYLNDEWITVNQVHQLNIGHQVTINEGKYGVFQNGTPAPYFAHFGNILRYSVALPLVSMPAMKLFDRSGDNFRFVVIILWASLPFLIALFISMCYPEYATIKSVRITVFGSAFGLLLLAINLPAYSPFRYSGSDAPVEVAAVIFTNHLLFAFTIVMTYLIARRIFNGRWRALLAVLVCTSCSTALFWAGTAKDHTATVAVFATMLYLFICSIPSRRFGYAACGFFAIGILAWIRPELGFTSLFCMGFFIIVENILRIQHKQETIRSGIVNCSAILFTGIGSIPLLINNFFTTGNPLVPPLLLEHSVRHGGTAVIVAATSPVANAAPHIVATSPFTIFDNFGSTLGNYIFSLSPNPLADLGALLFFPATGSIGFFFITPIALVALILLPFLLFKKNGETGSPPVNWALVMFLVVAVFSVILAYMHNLDLLNTDNAVAPDIRYFSPAYIPVVILSLIFLEKTILLAHPKILVKKICTLGILMVPGLLVLSILMNPLGNTRTSNYFSFFILLIIAEVMVIVALTIVYYYWGRKGDMLSDLCIPVLVLTVLSCQMMIIILVSPAIKFNGYTFWIPGVDVLYHSFIQVTRLP